MDSRLWSGYSWETAAVWAWILWWKTLDGGECVEHGLLPGLIRPSTNDSDECIFIMRAGSTKTDHHDCQIRLFGFQLVRGWHALLVGARYARLTSWVNNKCMFRGWCVCLFFMLSERKCDQKFTNEHCTKFEFRLVMIPSRMLCWWRHKSYRWATSLLSLY